MGPGSAPWGPGMTVQAYPMQGSTMQAEPTVALKAAPGSEEVAPTTAAGLPLPVVATLTAMGGEPTDGA